jgi:hypothetical protein
MAILEVFKFAVRPERLNEMTARLNAFEAWTRKRSDLWASMRSYHAYTRPDAAESVRCMEVLEFDNLANEERNYAAAKEDPEYLSIHLPAFTDLIIPGSLEREIWNGVV